MSEDREKEREEGQKRPSRPVTAAARRERRGTTRPAARADGEGRTGQSRATGAKGPGDAAKQRGRAGAKPEANGEAKGKATPKRDRRDKRPSPPARLMRFLREVVAELRKVIWPTRKQMVTYTAVVLVFVAFMVAVISGLDIGLAKGVFWLFG